MSSFIKVVIVSKESKRNDADIDLAGPKCELIESTQKWCWTIRFCCIDVCALDLKSESMRPRTLSNRFFVSVIFVMVSCVCANRMTIDSNGQMAKQKRQQCDRNDDDADDDYGEEDKTSKKKP